VALFPQLHYPTPTQEWWASSSKDAAWWDAWFEQYSRFAIHFADLADQSGASALVIGGKDVSPALPGGVLLDGMPSGVPADCAQRWSVIIKTIRAHFSGAVYWAVDYPADAANSPEFLSAVDQIYFLWSIDRPDPTDASLDSREKGFNDTLDSILLPLHEKSGKPIILGMDIPLGSAEQLTAYNAIFAALNSYPWINGLISRGFFPPVAMQDGSASVNGKPASAVLWYWYPQLLTPTP
jgi:hypothetical protein